MFVFEHMINISHRIILRLLVTNLFFTQIAIMNFPTSSTLRHPSIFTARCYASAVYAMALVCLCLCLSVTSRSSTKTAKRRITQTTPHDSPGTLVFCCQRSPRNSTGSPPTGAPNAGGVGQNRRLSTNNGLYLENGTR